MDRSNYQALGAQIDATCSRLSATNNSQPSAAINNWYLITDANVAHALRPLIESSQFLSHAPGFIVTPGEANKTLSTATAIWEWLSASGATRHSGIINLGGGMITDLGGFTAACFKRGIPFVNIPTTLLGAVDASVGGKTGVNLNTLKNEVGAFARPADVVISSLPLSTLPHRELLSGYAEMVKTGLIASRELWLDMLPPHQVLEDSPLLTAIMQRCVDFKREVTDEDAREHDRRRILNFGHTAGHAFESLSYRRNQPLSHGEAVALGMITALVLSNLKLQMPTDTLHTYINSVYKACFKPPVFGCKDYPELLELMAHDKKNTRHDSFSFVLLREPGVPVCGCETTADDVRTALDVTRDLIGI
ncbi:MAG: 3-dehydroquinate synthase [Muribaculaceae bacterium]|nr:3-dehydroquinate synthase [Muribaculaceae bacterium]